MRARQVKPEFFRDKKMGALGPVAALVYQALWCMADDGGVALCMPELVKGEMFIFWPMIGLPEISTALELLAEAKRIRRYSIGDNEYALLPTFPKHQSVHNPSAFRHPRPEQAVTEPKLPLLPEDGGSLTGEGGQSSHPNIPSSSTPTIPTSSTPDGAPQSGRNGDLGDQVFEEIWTQYPKRSGGDSKHDALLAFRARVKAGEDPIEMLAGVRRYHAYCTAMKKVGTEYVKQARTFLGRSRHYLEKWELPPGTTTPPPRKGAPREYDYGPGPTPSSRKRNWQQT